jgi:hypothetical protein
MPEQERFAELKRQAWEDRDLDLFEFYSSLEYELKCMRAVGRACAGLWRHGGNDATWNAMFEALSDAGLLVAEEAEED